MTINPIQLLDVANGIRGFKVIGENTQDDTGRSVSSAGDGIDDLIIGARLNDAAASKKINPPSHSNDTMRRTWVRV